LRREALWIAALRPTIAKLRIPHPPAVEANTKGFSMALYKTLLGGVLTASFSVITYAQSAQRVETITVTAKSAPVLDVDQTDVGGFDAALAKTPQSITVFGSDLLSATATQSLSNALKLDASLADSYNTAGYIESLSIRGFILSNENNFRRNGLALSNHAPIALENKERIEVMKGVAGLQSGVSAPGGLVNYITKVPLKTTFTGATLNIDEYGGNKVHIDSNTSIAGIGLRLNVANEQLRSHFDRANGSRQFASIALAKAITANTSLSADFEFHKKRQPSVPGLGLLDVNGDGIGEQLPASINPQLNLNSQVWSLPFESKANIVQMAMNHRLNEAWSAKLAASAQRSTINDRIAFPDGCSNAATYVYPGLCANGDVDVYDFRSDNEKRSVVGWEASLNGRFRAIGLPHRIKFSLNGRQSKADLAPLQAYNYVGSANIFAPIELPASPALTELNTDTAERAIDISASLQTSLTDHLQSFIGSRNSRLHRESARSDGSRAIAFSQTVSTPWLGLSYAASQAAMIYASWGQGVELEAVPNRPNRFVNFGAVLPALKSDQIELGAKWQANARLLVTAAMFDIRKPYADDITGSDERALRVAGAKRARHRGIELSATGRVNDAWSVQASATSLDATFTRAINPALVGSRVTNVPTLKASLFSDYKIAAIPGLAINALITLENGKTVDATGSAQLPRAWQIDAGLRYQQTLVGKSVLWRINVENLTNRTYWREAPTQPWGGVYLFPAAPRTARASVTVDF
jgi:iron complex outermembrane recepter protein